eukprot:TRINITY_DN2985_c0_g1_i1.p1 TRINITY_DN2985_c0_g1~~TRINITY_DN2985_c0_g1_i1.p1  ORF type:complete len:469 (-),score=102.86 TRINITY_DN2985_c0_g1_i1:90-1496(-)
MSERERDREKGEKEREKEKGEKDREKEKEPEKDKEKEKERGGGAALTATGLPPLNILGYRRTISKKTKEEKSRRRLSESWKDSISQENSEESEKPPPSPVDSPLAADSPTVKRRASFVSHRPRSRSLLSRKNPRRDRSTSSKDEAAESWSAPSKERIVRLNIGGTAFTTTTTTLFSRGPNFFTTLVGSPLSSTVDSTGAFFVDRNGDYFAPILDFLRYGELLIPRHLNQEALLREAQFYSVDLLPGLCGQIREGLYTSSQWIIFLERDPHNPWVWGITGVEDKDKNQRNIFVKRVCKVKDGCISWMYHGINYKIRSRDGNVYITNPHNFKSRYQLFFRCDPGDIFPLGMNEVLASEQTFHDVPLHLSFSVAPKGVMQAKIRYPLQEQTEYDVIVLCRRLIILSPSDASVGLNSAGDDSSADLGSPFAKQLEKEWVLYLHSDLAFFSFGHPHLSFGGSFHRLAPSGSVH